VRREAPELRGPGARAVFLVAGMLSLAGCGGARSFGELRADAAAIPVPSGVTFVRQSQSVEDGPGFTTANLEEVAREYRNHRPCPSLAQAWSTVLARAHRRFRRWDHPQSAGAGGQFGITVLDRPEHVGATLGAYYLGARACPRPFVYSFNDPH
jgi:hypothetical protein